MSNTTIEWSDAVWNPVRGCSRVSPGCQHCYAERVAHRFSGPGQPYEGLTGVTKQGAVWTGEVRFVAEMLDAPLRWRRPRRVFVNSMSDLFHDGVADMEIAAIVAVMAAAPQHTFQILTKRAERMRLWFEWFATWATNNASEPWHMSILASRALNVAGNAYENLRERAEGEAPGLFEARVSWPLPNVHLGVSVEDQPHADERIPHLLATPAAVRFVSYEPALGPLDLHRLLGGPVDTRWRVGSVDWVIVGGESGPGARRFELEWGQSVVEQCAAAGCACFVKQLGARPVLDGQALTMQDRKGGEPSEWPADMRVRQWPVV